MKFDYIKCHGSGNEFVMVDAVKHNLEGVDLAEFARFICDRNGTVGADGVLLLAKKGDMYGMRMFNPDGSEAEMCGNGIRCVAVYVYGKGLTDKKEFSIISAGKIKKIWLDVDENSQTRKVNSVRVDMGQPILEAENIPVLSEKETVVNEPIEVEGNVYFHTCVSMGNPHSVVYVDDVDNFPLERLGRHFENHPSFPKRVNTEFIQIIDRQNVKMRVWERGTGETFACGTGACATAVAGVLNGCTDKEITVHLLGGKLKIKWEGNGHPVYMTGAAEFVFEGEIAV